MALCQKRLEEATPQKRIWAACATIGEPNEQTYSQALRSGLARDRSEERDARVLAWWQSNDPFREDSGGRATPGRSAEQEKNIRALLLLLDETKENELLMKAEVYRELGKGAQALKLLTRIESGAYQRFAVLMEALCHAKDARV